MKIKDNSQNKKISDIIENDDSVKDLSYISGKSIKQIAKENKKFFIFPPNLSKKEDDIDNLYIFSFDNTSNPNTITTYNLMGIIGKNNTTLQIYSRFSNVSDKNENDFFLYYMLQKIYHLNIVNLMPTIKKGNIWDFHLMIFPYYLNRALKQGLYKKYVEHKFNDSKVKGVIDVARHLKLNNPFIGNVSYNVREHSFDNEVTQLIRHTIEFIKRDVVGKNILKNEKETIDNVNRIIYATPTYNFRDRTKVINKNIKLKKHPYFTYYTDLQNLCIKILKHYKVDYGQDKDNKIYGIIFDGAWLWEEYINTVLKQSKKFKFEHPQNRNKEGAINLFSDNNQYKIYPDFYYKDKDKSIVLDAKYKKLIDDKIDREDMHQIITYMHILEAKKGCFIYPQKKEENEDNFKIGEIGELKGYGGGVYKMPFFVPQQEDNDDFKFYQNEMKKSEKNFIEKFDKFSI